MSVHPTVSFLKDRSVSVLFTLYSQYVKEYLKSGGNAVIFVQ